MKLLSNETILNRVKLERALKPFMNDDDADAIVRLVMATSDSDRQPGDRAKIIEQVNVIVSSLLV